MRAPDSASAERAVAEAPLLSDVIEALPIGIAVFDDTAALLRFNPTFVSMNAALAGILRPGLDWAVMLREWHGRGVLSRRDQDRLAALEAALSDGIEPPPIEIEGTPGQCFEIALRATRGDGFVMVQSDTSLRRRSEQSQKEAEELLRNVLEACPANVIMSRVADGQILYRSPAATELLGTARSTHEHFARREERADFVTALLPMGRVDDMPVTGVRADGTRFPCLVSARLIDHRGDDVVVSSTVDISKEIALRKTLAEQREQIFLAEKMSALGELLAGVAHELNNPLSVVVGHALMMREDTADPEVLRRIDKIGSAAERCSRIVKSFLAMARQQPVRLRPTDLAETARQAVEALIHGPDGLSTKVEIDIVEAPPVHGDEHQITQVVLNLLANADQAIRDSATGGRIRISAFPDPGGRTVTLTVADDGPGIAEGIRSRIFDPLFTTKEVGRGTGIGLAFCHRIVTAHGGRIRFEPGDPGARFHVTLPVSQGAPSTGATADPDTVAPAVTSVLVVDDEPDVAELIREILSRDGFEVQSAESGEAALRCLAEGSFSLILTDLNMPGMGGRAFYETLLRIDPEQASRVAFVTGDTMSPQVRSFLDAASCPTLEKPIVPADLRRLVAVMRREATDG
jgi:signal transduction histidine kinase/ActR/RegA family two-component response regulator